MSAINCKNSNQSLDYYSTLIDIIKNHIRHCNVEAIGEGINIDNAAIVFSPSSNITQIEES